MTGERPQAVERGQTRGRVKLSPDEIDALIEGIAEGRVEAGTGLSPRGDVARHEFGAAAPQLQGELGALGILHERFARSLRRAMTPLLRFQPRVTRGPIESRAYDEYVAGLGSTMVCFNIVRVEPLRGNLLIALQPELVSALVDGFFGGRGRAALRRAAEFTPTEERVIQRLIEAMCNGLVRAWEDVVAMRCTFLGTESNAQLAVFTEQDDSVLSCQLVVHLDESSSATIDLLYPLHLLKPLLPALRSKVQSERSESSAEWRQRLLAALMNVELPVRSVLAEPVVPLRALARLAPGDILPIHVDDEVRVLVERTLLGSGMLGAARGTAAIRINRLATPLALTAQGAQR